MEFIKLGDITNNLDNKRIPLNSKERGLKESNPIYPYIGANNIMGYIDEYIFDEKILCIAEDGGNWGYNQTCSKIYSEKCWVNNHAHVVTAKDTLHLEFLMYFLNYSDLSLYITGATRGKLTKTALNSIKIPLPLLAEQKRIAGILDEADKLRQLNKQLITKYEQLSQSLFLDMFGGENIGSTIKLGKVIKLLGGGTPSKDVDEYWNGDISWASVKDLKSDILIKTIDKITMEGVNNSATRIVKRGSLIIATRMAVGKVVLTKIDTAINQDLKVIKILGNVNNVYLQYFLKSKKRYFESVSSGATVKGIKIEHITKLKVTLPLIDVQTQFAERVQLIEQQKQQAQGALQKSEDLFNALLQKSFKGGL